MAEFKKIMEIKKRICNQFKKCGECPLYKNTEQTTCGAFMVECPDEAETIMLQWDKEHPVKTRSADFFEKNPNAMKRPSGIPRVCAEDMGYCGGCFDSDDGFETLCDKCWNTPL